VLEGVCIEKEEEEDDDDDDDSDDDNDNDDDDDDDNDDDNADDNNNDNHGCAACIGRRCKGHAVLLQHSVGASGRNGIWLGGRRGLFQSR